jgi:ankyrin repeat protein
LHFAINGEHGQTAVWLIEHGADPEKINDDGKKPLQCTANKQIIDYIVKECSKLE